MSRTVGDHRRAYGSHRKDENIVGGSGHTLPASGTLGYSTDQPWPCASSYGPQIWYPQIYVCKLWFPASYNDATATKNWSSEHCSEVSGASLPGYWCEPVLGSILPSIHAPAPLGSPHHYMIYS